MGFLSDFWRSLTSVITGSLNAGPHDPAEAGNRIYVGNLSYQVKEEELRGFFSKVGRVKTLNLIRDRMTRRLKGYAFLEMSPQDARKALSLNGADFLGRKIVVSLAKTRQKPAFQRPQGAPSGRFRRRRSGPRAYGQTDNTPMERLE
jgi:RNA recognition motif-containing protein